MYPTVGVLYFGLSNSFHFSPSPLYLPPSIFQQRSIHMLTSSTFISYGEDITDVLSLSFSFPSFPEFCRVFHCYKRVLYLSLYMIVLVFVTCLSLDLSSTYERKHMACVFLSLAHCPDILIHTRNLHSGLCLLHSVGNWCYIFT
jgi:hypothetical protein